MDFRVLVSLIALFVAVSCDTVADLKADPQTNSKPKADSVDETANTTESSETTVKTPAITSITLPTLCEVCNCTAHFVNCSDRGLKNHLDDSQWPKSPLDEVSFKGNLLDRVTPFPAVSIGKLILRQNRITEIDNAAFKKIANLTELDLSHNQLKSEVLSPHVFEGKFSPEAYEPLTVTKLNLASNALHTLHQDLFEHLTALTVLNLAGNPFNVVDGHTQNAISSLAYLEELDFSYCNLDELPNHIFHGPKYLKKLHLHGNRFTTIPRAVDDAKNLEYLCLDQNPIQIIDNYNAFPVMPKLTELSLASLPHLTEIGAGAFSQLTALESLHVQYCPNLVKIDEDALVKRTPEGAVWPPLKKLDLSDNALRYLPWTLVGTWERLEELDLMNNEWSCDCDNQYLIGTLLPQHGKRLMGDEVEELKCAMPPEHAGKNLTSLANWKLRCLDLYDARPEKDAAVLVGILIGLLLAVPIGMAIFVFWRRGFLFCSAQNPATFSRAFYKRTANEEDM